MQIPEITQLMTRRGWLVRGEAIVASTGLALAVILLIAMATSAWWMIRTQRDAAASTRDAHVEGLSVVLAQSAEALMAIDEVSPLRRLVADAARENGFASCRIVLSSGGVIADSNPSRITVNHLPEHWAGSFESPSPDGSVDSNVRVAAIEIPGRGSAQIEIVPSPLTPALQSWESQAGIGAIGAVGMLALLLIYRRIRSQLWAIGAIRDALLARHAGEQASTALTVHAEGAPEAQAWNDLIAELDRLRTQMVAEQAQDRRSPQGSGFADLEGVCDAMWQGLLLIDDQLRIKYANGAAAVLLRAKREDILGCDVTTLALDNSLLDPIRQVVGGTVRRRVTSEVKLQGEDGQGVLRFGVRPVRRGDTAAAMVIIEDVTQQRLAEEARNLFVAQATHELRMPLTNIRLYVENAMEAGTRLSSTESNQSALSPEEARQLKADSAHALNVINQESKRLERIVGDILSVAEIEAGTLKMRTGDIRLDTLFDELNSDYQAHAKDKGVTLTFNLPPKLPAIRGDRDKVTLALHNLIGNAIKYTPAGGTVSVNVEVTDTQLIVEVNDTGIGIAEDELERVFEKFYRSKKDQRVSEITGTGLGLSVARELIRLHRGDITVRSQPDNGSTFTLAVPTMLEAA